MQTLSRVPTNLFQTSGTKMSTSIDTVVLNIRKYPFKGPASNIITYLSHHNQQPRCNATPYRCELCVRWWYDMLPRPVFCVESDSEVGAVWILTCFERFHRFDVCMFYDIRWSKILAHTAWRRRHWIKWWYDTRPRTVFCVEFDFEVDFEVGSVWIIMNFGVYLHFNGY